MQKQIKDLKRNMILDAAEKHFHEFGYDKTQVNAIAGELNIAVGTIYNLFESKEHLFISYLQRKIFQATELFVEEMKKESDPSLRIKKFIESHFHFIKTNEKFVKEHMLMNPLYFKQVRHQDKNPAQPVKEMLKEALNELAQKTPLVMSDTAQLSYFVCTFSESYIKRWLDEGVEFASKVDEAYEILMNFIVPNNKENKCK